MKISNVKKTENTLTFSLSGVSVAFANTLRRLMITEVPTLAVDTVTFFDNNSALYDEVVAHRIGMIPIKTDLKTFVLPEDCKCKGKGCPKCQVKFILNKEGPCTVYSRDMTCSDSKIKVADENIPIVKLIEGQKLKFEANAVLGRGKQHAKWQPGVISYSYEPMEKGKPTFNFFIESDGSLKPKEIVVKAAEILNAKAVEFAKELK